MRYLPSLVTVRDIQPRTARAEHPAETIEQLAREILAAGGLARPLVVRQTGMASFALLDGELAYHAAARARELDPVKAEAVLAFIATRENEAELLSQVAALNGVNGSLGAGPAPIAGDVGAVLVRVEQQLQAQFRRFEEHQRQQNEAFRTVNLELQMRIPQPSKVLDLLNGEDDARLADFLRDTGTKADELLEAIEKQREFKSLQEAIKRVKPLTAARVVKLTDLCEKYVPLRAPKARQRGVGRDVARV